ncbi:hypothetical protein AAHA92_23764 [Salvia divinorum]|uniref:Uncharacterized protein n=1 Tax=Salvia divinorum TaxID=28513 RepID=A0ABD1GT05_SALDI
MAYNLQPLITILEGILDPDQTRWIVDENNPQFQSILDKATSLQQLLDRSSVTKLDSQIREVAHRAEDIVESHTVHQMISGYDSATFTFTTPDLLRVGLDLDSLVEQAGKLVETEGDSKMLRELDSAVEQLKLVEMEDEKMLVGIDEDLMQLKDCLTFPGTQTRLGIVPIVEYCSESAVESAERIEEEQSENGNDDLKVRIVERTSKSCRIAKKGRRIVKVKHYHKV